ALQARGVADDPADAVRGAAGDDVLERQAQDAVERLTPDVGNGALHNGQRQEGVAKIGQPPEDGQYAQADDEDHDGREAAGGKRVDPRLGDASVDDAVGVE